MSSEPVDENVYTHVKTDSDQNDRIDINTRLCVHHRFATLTVSNIFALMT